MMQVEKELAEQSPRKDTLLTIGVFDGVHLGHRYLIDRLKEQAQQQDLLSGVVTFRQHPQEVLSPQTELPYLTTLAQKVELLKEAGVDVVVPLSFSQELAQLSAVQFVGLLKKYLRMRGLVVGPDFVLGRDKEGDADTLRRLGQAMDFSVTVTPPARVNGDVISSTAIRQALADGDMKRVVRLTGRPYRLEGKVTSGTHRGTELGFPTANLEVDARQALPAEGIYATWAFINGQTYKAMTYIGRRPTFGSNERTIETYILNYSGNLYGHDLAISVVAQLRRDRRFATIEELKKQIGRDIEKGEAILASEVVSKI